MQITAYFFQLTRISWASWNRTTLRGSTLCRQQYRVLTKIIRPYRLWPLYSSIYHCYVERWTQFINYYWQSGYFWRMNSCRFLLRRNLCCKSAEVPHRTSCGLWQVLNRRSTFAHLHDLNVPIKLCFENVSNFKGHFHLYVTDTIRWNADKICFARASIVRDCD